MPVFRLRREEKTVLNSFDFGESIFPCIEIIKELDIKPREPSSNTPLKKTVRKIKTFESVYLPVIDKIKSSKVFIDLPVHLNESNNLKPEVLQFIRRVINKRDLRTNYMLKLAAASNKIIPIISTYSQKTGEPNTIILQEKDLRSTFDIIAYRTFEKTFLSDLMQINQVAKANDYLIIDLEENLPDPKDEDLITPILEKLKTFNKCHKIILRSSVPNNLRNNHLDHGNKITEIDNRLIYNYTELSGDSFGDYSGIKKDRIEKGGSISPGFIYYDPIGNVFYGYKGVIDKLESFKDIIVPSVINSQTTERMRLSDLDYLKGNQGWNLIQLVDNGLENGKSMGKFKRISMLHYLHCLKTKIDAGVFDN